MLFVRFCRRPRHDLKRGYSYNGACFGDEKEAHAGLCGYACVPETIDLALEALNGYFGHVAGRKFRSSHSRCFVCLYDGAHNGIGPDGEDLFHPRRLVCAIAADKVSTLEELDRLQTEAHAALDARNAVESCVDPRWIELHRKASALFEAVRVERHRLWTLAPWGAWMTTNDRELARISLRL